LNTGEATGVPIIKKLLEESSEVDKQTFVDCPPGSACIVMESIKDADYCILVSEPTLFGVHNLNMVYELVKLLISRSEWFLTNVWKRKSGREVCLENNIKILGRIPFDNELGTLNSNAEIAVNKNEEYRELFFSA